jgi:2'-5' RNA ligase
MRTFIASPINVDGEIKDLLKHVSMLPSLRVPNTVELHLTYLFMGEVDEIEAQNMAESVLKPVIRRIESGFSGITAFPDASRPRVLVLLLDNPEIAGIYRSVSEILPRYAAGSKKFVPHITIGRFGKSPVMPDIKKLKIPENKVLIDRVCLYRSTLTSSGPLYENLACNQLI